MIHLLIGADTVYPVTENQNQNLNLALETIALKLPIIGAGAILELFRNMSPTHILFSLTFNKSQ
jgi:hypothetical protein